MLNQRLKNVRVGDVSFIKHRNGFLVENELPIGALFGMDCYYIQHADALIVNLTDDISVGGSQEIFIAKQFGRPVIGIAPRGGKFNKLKYELGGKTFWNWVHPFVDALCDVVVQDVDEAAEVLDNFNELPASGLAAIDDILAYYLRSASSLDTSLNSILAFKRDSAASSKQRLRIYLAGKMGPADNFPVAKWRQELTALITRKSRFEAVNLDFLEASHSAIDENDPRLIFGRDAYLIRSSDLVVVNLSDDISVGGSVEMLLAKYYRRPLIGVARYNGKFVSDKKDLLGRTVTAYINPFVSATCDWLVHDPHQLPGVIDNLFTGTPIKSSLLVPAAADWYKKFLLPRDRGAQVAFT